MEYFLKGQPFLVLCTPSVMEYFLKGQPFLVLCELGEFQINTLSMSYRRHAMIHERRTIPRLAMKLEMGGYQILSKI